MWDPIGNMIYDWITRFIIKIYEPLDSSILSWLYVKEAPAKTAETFSEGGFCQSVFNSLTMFAGVLLLIYLFTSLTDKMIKELASTQVAIKALMELLVASIILLHGYSLVSGFACIGDNVINFILKGDKSTVALDVMQGAADEYGVVFVYNKNENTGKYKFYAPYADTLRDTIKQIDGTRSHYNTDDGVILPQNESIKNHTKWDKYFDANEGKFASALMKLMLLNLVSTFIGIAAIAAAVGRLIQLAVYVCLSPIAIVNIFGEGMHSQGIRYFKKIFACSLQGPAMAIILYLSADFSLHDLGAISYIAIQLATLMALFKASTFANDVVL